MTIATLGGIFLIIGAWFVFKGNVYMSVGMYFIADIMWVIIAFQSGDISGSIIVLIGMLFGLAAFLKMNFGVMRKTLRW